MKFYSILTLAVALGACDGSATRPEPEPEPVVVQVSAVVIVQLADAQPGAEPLYIVTGQARTIRNGVSAAASIDSVVLSYRLADAAWVRLRRSPQMPVTGTLPFEAESGQAYSLRAQMYAHGMDDDGVVVRAEDEWVATARAY
jgi:hypothetical protein